MLQIRLCIIELKRHLFESKLSVMARESNFIFVFIVDLYIPVPSVGIRRGVDGGSA